MVAMRWHSWCPFIPFCYVLGRGSPDASAPCCAAAWSERAGFVPEVEKAELLAEDARFLRRPADVCLLAEFLYLSFSQRTGVPLIAFRVLWFLGRFSEYTDWFPGFLLVWGVFFPRPPDTFKGRCVFLSYLGFRQRHVSRLQFLPRGIILFERLMLDCQDLVELRSGKLRQLWICPRRPW